MKKSTIALTILGALLFFCLSFHVMFFPYLYVFPKSHLTLENTFMSKADIEKMYALYRSSSDYDKLLMKQDPLFKKLKLIFSRKNKVNSSEKIDWDKFVNLMKSGKIKKLEVINKSIVFIYLTDKADTSDPDYYCIIENTILFSNTINEINEELDKDLRLFPEYIEEQED